MAQREWPLVRSDTVEQEMDEAPVRVVVGFSTSAGLLSRLIRYFSRSKASHAWLCLSVFGMEVIVHATVGGVKVVPRSRWEKGNKIVGEFRVRADVSDGVRHVLSYLGQKYDYLGLFGFLKVTLWKRWFRKKVRNPWAGANALVCSEFVAHLAHRGGIPEWASVDAEAVTPGELLALCEEGGTFEKIGGTNGH